MFSSKIKNLLGGVLLALVITSSVAAAWLPLASSFVSLFDGISSQYGSYSITRAVTSYTGPVYTVRRDYDSATLDIYGTGATGSPDIGALQTWLDGFTGYVVTWYDQSGNARHLTQTTAAKQPQLKFEGTYPVIDFYANTGFASQEFDGTTGLASVAQNINALSVLAIRQHDAVPTATRSVVFISNNVGSTRSAITGVSSGLAQASGRRLDANTNQTTTGIVIDTNWHTEFGRWDYANAHLVHNIDASSETRASFQTTGSTSNTASAYVGVGGDTGAGADLFKGKMSGVVFTQTLLTDPQVSSLVSSLVPLKVARTVTDPDWIKNALTGSYTLLTSQTDYTVLNPNGNTPVENDLLTHKYHHHTQIVVDSGGRVWEMFSSGGTNEDASGQQTAIMSSADDGATWLTPAVVIPSQSTFSGTGATDVIGTRISYPRKFVFYLGDLYAVGAVDEITAVSLGGRQLGILLAAAKCNPDGTLGTLFRVSSASYTPIDGKAAIAYDATLGPPIFALADLYGTWGGSSPGNTASAWIGWATKHSESWAEPATMNLNVTGTSLFRFWRRVTNTTRWWWGQSSSDNGLTWDTLRALNIPNSPSAGAALRLSDNRLTFVFNPIDSTISRDPLALGLFSPTTGLVTTIRAIRQGLTNNPVYPGTNKAGGAQYPGTYQNGDTFYVSYDIHKETVSMTKFSISTNLP